MLSQKAERKIKGNHIKLLSKKFQDGGTTKTKQAIHIWKLNNIFLNKCG